MSVCRCGCGQRTSLAAQTRRDRGQIKGEPVHFVRGHATRGVLRPILERIAANEQERDLGHETLCRVQVSGLGANGYGQIRDADGRIRRTHIVTWEAANGRVPEGHELDHLCHPIDGSCPGGRLCPHRACHELSHLAAAVIADNRRRTVRNGRTHA